MRALRDADTVISRMRDTDRRGILNTWMVGVVQGGPFFDEEIGPGPIRMVEWEKDSYGNRNVVEAVPESELYLLQKPPFPGEETPTRLVCNRCGRVETEPNSKVGGRWGAGDPCPSMNAADTGMCGGELVEREAP